MPQLHQDLKVNPLCRLIWTGKPAKDYWEERVVKSQQFMQKVRVEALKRNIFKTHSFWIGVSDKNNITISELESSDARQILSIPAGTSPYRRHKAYVGHKEYEGNFHVFTNRKNVPMFQASIFNKYDLNLTLGYCEADSENMFWYYTLAGDGVIDPTGEMQNPDKMNFYLNPFLRSIGISILPYVAKSWDDEYSLNLAKQIVDLMNELDPEATKDVVSLLEMPARFDSWRAVSEVHTPILKVITDSTPYKEKVLIDYEVKMSHYIRHFIPGASYGTVFPYISKKEERRLINEGTSPSTTMGCSTK